MSNDSFGFDLTFNTVLDKTKINTALNDLKNDFANVGNNLKPIDTTKLKADIMSLATSFDVVSISAGKVGTAIQKAGDSTKGLTDKLKGATQGVEKEFENTGKRAGAAMVNQINSAVKNMQGSFKEALSPVLSVFGGNALFAGASSVVGSFKDLIDKGKQSLQVTQDLRIAFGQAGLSGSDLSKAVSQASKDAVKLANQFAMPVAEVRNYSQAAAALGGATGQANADLTKLAIGVSKATNGLVSGDMAIRLFSKGIADPESAMNMSRLTKQFPALGAALKDIKDPAEMTRKALEFFNPTFQEMSKQADGPLGSMQRLDTSFSQIKSSIGKLIVEALAPLVQAFAQTVLPAIQSTVKFIGGLIEYVKPLSPLFIGLGVGLGVVAVGMLAVSAGTWVATAATAAWNAVLMANPIFLIVGGIAALVAGVYALSSAWGDSAEKRKEQYKAEKELLDKDINDNKNKQEQVKNNQALIDQYVALGNQSEKTAEDQAKMNEIADKLNESYPGVISYSKSFTDNLTSLAVASVDSSIELNKLQKEMENMRDKAQILELKDLSNNVEISKEKVVEAFKDMSGSMNIAFDELNKSAQAGSQVMTNGKDAETAFAESFAESIQNAANSQELQKAIAEAKDKINSWQITPQDRQKIMKAVTDMEATKREVFKAESKKTALEFTQGDVENNIKHIERVTARIKDLQAQAKSGNVSQEDKNYLERLKTIKEQAETGLFDANGKLIQSLSKAKAAGNDVTAEVQKLAKAYGKNPDEIMRLVEAQAKHKAKAEESVKVIESMADAYGAVNSAMNEAYNVAKSEYMFVEMARKGYYDTLLKSGNAQLIARIQTAKSMSEAEVSAMKATAKDNYKITKDAKEEEEKLNVEIEGKKEKRRSSEKKKESQFAKEMAKIDEEILKMRADITLQGIMDEQTKEIKSKENQIAEQVRIIKNEIETVKKSTEFNSKEREDLQTKLNEKLTITEERGQKELYDIRNKYLSKQLENERKYKDDVINNEIELLNKRIAVNKMVIPSITNLEQLRILLTEQSNFEIDLLKKQAQKEIQTFVEKDEAYIKQSKDLLYKKTNLANMTKTAMEQSIKGQWEAGEYSYINNWIVAINAAKEQTKTMQGDVTEAENKLKAIEDNISKNPIIQAINFKLNLDVAAVEKNKADEVRAIEIKKNRDYLQQKRDLQIFEAEKAYNTEYETAKGSYDKQLEAWNKYIEAKKKAEKEYQDNTMTTGERLAKQAQDILNDSVKNMKWPGMDTSEALSQMKKEEDALKQSYQKREISLREYLAKKATLEDKYNNKQLFSWKEIGTAFKDSLVEQIKTSFDSHQKMISDLSKAKETAINNLFEFDKKYYSQQTVLTAEQQAQRDTLNDKAKSAESDILVTKSVMYTEYYALMLDKHKNYLKAGILTALAAAKAEIPIWAGKAIATEIGSKGVLGIVTGGLAAASIYALLSLFESAVGKMNFYRGVVGFNGRGTTTSDDNLVNISKSESIITAKGTYAKGNYKLLEWINNTGGSWYDYALMDSDNIIQRAKENRALYNREKEVFYHAFIVDSLETNKKLLDSQEKQIRLLKEQNLMLTENNKKLSTLINTKESRNDININVKSDKNGLIQEMKTSLQRELLRG